jgi:hypothetical protein
VFCIYDVMQGKSDAVQYPVPWAETAATSHLTTADEMGALLRDAGFAVTEVEDRTAFAIDFFRRSLSNAAAGAPPLGLHIVMGPSTPAKFRNMLANLQTGAIAPTVMVARRAG